MSYDKSAGRAKRIGKRAYPLRKIIKRNVSAFYRGIWFERLHQLECGHYMPPVSDIYGETATTSMRCRDCYEENNLKLSDKKERQ
jgi:hypothetical protein